MNFLLTTYLSSLIILVGIIGAIVYFTDPLKGINRAFVIFSFGSAIWIASSAFDPFIHNQILANALVYLSYVGGALIALNFLYLSYVFPYERVPNWLWTVIGMSSLTFLTFLSIPKFLVEAVLINSLPNGYHDVVHGAGYTYFIILFLLFMFWSFSVLAYKMRQSVGEEKKQLRLFFWGVLIPFIINSYFAFFRSITTENEVAWAGPSFAVIWIIAMLVAIRKHHLLRVDLLASEILIIISILFALVQVILSDDPAEFVLKLIIFSLLIVFALIAVRFSILKRRPQ